MLRDVEIEFIVEESQTIAKQEFEGYFLKLLHQEVLKLDDGKEIINKIIDKVDKKFKKEDRSAS